MRVRFRGVRGSVPWATPESIGHGCNTPCVELQDERTGATLLLDAGTGLVAAGASLDAAAREVTILLTHYHWDHVQGLPLFAPLFRPGTSVHVVSPRLGATSDRWAAALFAEPFFPVPAERLPSPPQVRLSEPRDLQLAGFSIRMHALRHPGGSMAYRIAGTSGDLVYATDHEPGDPEQDGALATFAFNAGALILDAHFTPEELTENRGVGHGSWRSAAELASSASAGHLYLFHHKPGRSDRELEAIEERTRRIFPASSTAREGAVFSL